MADPAAVILEMMMVLEEPGHPPRPVVAELACAPDAPHAVTARLRTGRRCVEWTFSLDLLQDGWRVACGVGNAATARPGSDDEDRIPLELAAPIGTATLSASASAIADFLDRSDSLARRPGRSARSA